ncbi:MAG TPA: hypothetical protein VHZ51_19020 [Ktedonobacteraceae bacterium]|jgi:hypothetical protein|nr:hypothetical protein [Ktedonobacteraceae bacterium]
MANAYGKWPGVIAIVADADVYCVPCAKGLYSETTIQAVVDGTPGYEAYQDHEGNPFGVVLRMSEDLHCQYCGCCHSRLCDDTCSCYRFHDVESFLRSW